MTEIKIEEGKSKKIRNIEIKVEKIEDIIIMEDGVRSKITQVQFVVKQGKEGRIFDGTSYSDFKISGYKIRINDCAVGTLDWKSFAIFNIDNLT